MGCHDTSIAGRYRCCPSIGEDIMRTTIAAVLLLMTGMSQAAGWSEARSDE